MQRTRAGIPVNVPRGYRKNMKVQSVKNKNRVIARNPYTHFAELTRTVDGLEETEIGPVGTKAFRKAIKDGFEIVNEWHQP